MAQLPINPASVTVVPVAVAQRATIWTKDSNDNLVDTGQLKKDPNGTQIWNIPARVTLPGVATPIATKITMTSHQEPSYPLEVPVQVEGLSILIYSNANLSITGISNPREKTAPKLHP